MSFDLEARFFRSLFEPGATPARVLIVGCGDGKEAGYIARETGAFTVALDLAVDARAKQPGLQLLRADARRLPFRDGAFDALYCYHVLEHVPGPGSAVAEAGRVLGGDGVGFFGTPNRSRLVGYVGGRATLQEKVSWNVSDWKRRLRGRWSNEQGAHAGFTERELGRLLSPVFARIGSVSQAYYEAKYPRLGWLWRLSSRLGFAGLLMPSVYFRAIGGARPPRDP